jgi:hypothetical protein
MLKRFTLMALGLLAIALPTFAADVNYVELRGRIVAMEIRQSVPSGAYNRVSLTLATDDRVVGQTITADCALQYSALGDLCRNVQTWMTCPYSTANSSGDGESITYHQCNPGTYGKCGWGWGYLAASGSEQRPRLETLYTQQNTSCSPK